VLNKLLSIEKLKIQLAAHKKRGETVVFTNGCFDVLHVGHLTLLEQAKAFGDVLCVGINSDDSVKKLKGATRPVYNQFDRARLLAALSVVDYVVIFDELTPVEIIAALKPDIHVKGGDYDPNDFEAMPEAKVVKKYGGEIKIVKLVPGHSTSNTIRKLTC